MTQNTFSSIDARKAEKVVSLDGRGGYNKPPQEESLYKTEGYGHGGGGWGSKGGGHGGHWPPVEESLHKTDGYGGGWGGKGGGRGHWPPKEESLHKTDGYGGGWGGHGGYGGGGWGGKGGGRGHWPPTEESLHKTDGYGGGWGGHGGYGGGGWGGKEGGGWGGKGGGGGHWPPIEESLHKTDGYGGGCCGRGGEHRPPRDEEGDVSLNGRGGYNNPHPLVKNAAEAEKNNVNGFIVALVEAFEEQASWPKLFYMSGKGGDIFSQRTFAAIGKGLRSVEEEEAGHKLIYVSSIVGEGEVKSDPLTVAGMFGSGCSSLYFVW
ncbi:glycine-rich cell wall structural protein 1.8-like [Chenopodium quinoa]|uniref:glycine-rich cell wall structural protein 1.8-like n=1 Tax=Chenopodium quinoa TaxID=63459 RepID=UPI000B780A93|nr:glycine-rich cell wall structural protein 1.8-like [Chenopodium quinoa]